MTQMPSPLPGMDPYIEAPDIWSDFHGDAAAAMPAELNRVLRLQVCSICVGKLSVEQVVVVEVLKHYPAHFGIVPLPGELHHHPLADMGARQGSLPTAQVSDECQGVWPRPSSGTVVMPYVLHRAVK